MLFVPYHVMHMIPFTIEKENCKEYHVILGHNNACKYSLLFYIHCECKHISPWHILQGDHPLYLPILWVDIDGIRRAFLLSVEAHVEAPETVLQNLVSGNLDGWNLGNIYVEALGYILIAKHPSGLIFWNVFVGDAILGEADTLRIGNGIITGNLAVGRWADSQVDIGAYIILAATGKGKR